MRKLLALAVIGGIVYWFLNRGGADDGQSATIGYVDGSAVIARAGIAGARPARADRVGGAAPVTDDLGRLLVEHALLEGDFVLRSGKRSSWYLDKYRFETRPDLLAAHSEPASQRWRVMSSQTPSGSPDRPSEPLP